MEPEAKKLRKALVNWLKVIGGNETMADPLLLMMYWKVVGAVHE